MKPCLDERCPRPATYRGYCREHSRERNRATSPNKAVYNSKRWKALRARKLFEEPICEEEGCNELATEVHHRVDIQDGGDPFPPTDGLEALCASHHGQETRRRQVVA